VEQEIRALSQQLKLAAICIVGAWLAGTCLMLCIALAFPRQVALWVLGVLCVLFAITSLVSWQLLQHAAKRERLFSSLARQLRLDAQALESLAEGDENG
jgi:fatty acid desaturase